MPPVINLDKCTGCGICEAVCPGDLIYTDEQTGQVGVRYPDECWYCGSCRADCPADAVTYEFPEAALRGS